jgi:2-dehydropantoate 2-reductase
VPRGDAIRYVITSAREQPTTIGELDGSKSARIVAIASALRGAEFPVSVSKNMDAWLKTRVAEILPTVCALYQAGCEPEQLASSDESLLLFLMRRMVKSETTAIKLGHAEQGRAEWQRLAKEFRSLIEGVDVPTPSIDVAYHHLSPASAAAD